jgi:hypothetical protein
MSDSWDNVRDLRRRAGALREKSSSLQEKGRAGWSIEAAKKDREAESLDKEADRMAGRLSMNDSGLTYARWRDAAIAGRSTLPSESTLRHEWENDVDPAEIRSLPDPGEEFEPSKWRAKESTMSVNEALIPFKAGDRVVIETILGQPETVTALKDAMMDDMHQIRVYQFQRDDGRKISRHGSVVVGLGKPATRPKGTTTISDSGEPPIVPHEVEGPNPLLQNRIEAAKLKDASIAAARSATATCGIGKTKALGRAALAKVETATRDLQDHWTRALKVKTASEALAELAHAALAAREAHGSDEYERRAVRMVETAASIATTSHRGNRSSRSKYKVDSAPEFVQPQAQHEDAFALLPGRDGGWMIVDKSLGEPGDGTAWFIGVGTGFDILRLLVHDADNEQDALEAAEEEWPDRVSEDSEIRFLVRPERVAKGTADNGDAVLEDGEKVRYT